MSDAIPWPARLLLVYPRAVRANLDRVRAAGLLERVPNEWQLALGILRMWHRIAFRTETVGTCAEHAVRPTWRARLLHRRGLRLPFLLAEGAVIPLDLTGLASSPERLVRHLLGAHHDGNQFVYDLQILSCYPGRLEQLRDAARDVVGRDTPRSRWLRDLTVYERYHENLCAMVDRAIAGELSLPPEQADDPDITFTAYMRWCARQPRTPAETWRAWRAGRYTVAGGAC